jgi:excisionase family DNA binding protein
MRDTDTYEQPDDLLPIGDTARLLGVSVPTIRRWESEGKIAGTRTLGGQRRFSRSEIERVRLAATA